MVENDLKDNVEERKLISNKSKISRISRTNKSTGNLESLSPKPRQQNETIDASGTACLYGMDTPNVANKSLMDIRGNMP